MTRNYVTITHKIRVLALIPNLIHYFAKIY